MRGDGTRRVSLQGVPHLQLRRRGAEHRSFDKAMQGGRFQPSWHARARRTPSRRRRKKDRIELRNAEEFDATDASLEAYDNDTSRLHCFVGFGLDDARRISADDLPQMQLVRADGAEGFGDYRDRWQGKICVSLQHDFRCMPPVDGVAHYQVDLQRHFNIGEATLDGMVVRDIAMRGYVAISQRKMVLKSAFNVETRGRVAFFGDEYGERFALHLYWPNRPKP